MDRTIRTARTARTGRLRAATLVTAAALALLVPTAADATGQGRWAGPLTDLDPAAGVLDGASARVQVVAAGDRTLVTMHVKDIDRAAAGTVFGAHLHTGTCVHEDGGAAGPHFNIDAYEGSPTPEVSAATEVWLDFTVRPGGTGSSGARVPFLVPAGSAHAVVIHALPTAPNGAAGPRLACLTVEL